AALAAAVIEHLLEAGALMIVTTHLSALKSFAVNDGRIVNASMEFDAATGQPTYRMISGIPGRSRAIDVAKMIGLPSPVIERARDDVARQVSAEIKNLRANANAREVVKTLTKPVEKAMEFIPAEQREVHPGDRAEHRKFKVTGEVVSVDGNRAVLNVNGR